MIHKVYHIPQEITKTKIELAFETQHHKVCAPLGGMNTLSTDDYTE